MKALFIIALSLLTTSAFAGMDCVGTTIVFHDDGRATSTQTELKKIEGDKDYSVYFGESDVFRFYADHDEEAKMISLEVLDKQDTLIVTNPKIPVARFSVSVGGYWKNYFTSLSCGPR